MKKLLGIASVFVLALVVGTYSQVLGASLPQGTAVFESSLASRINSTDTSMTLVSTSTASGEVLPSGYHCFVIDEGRTDAESVCGTLTSAKTVTGLTRGVSSLTGTSTVAANQHAHRVGANVKITDFPLIQILRHQAAGAETYPTTLKYASGVTPANPDDLTDKGYVDGLAFSGAGVIDATTVAKGVVELATGCEAASSTSSGGSGPLAVSAALATSTRTSLTLAACKVVVANNSGVIDDNFIATSTLFATSSISTGPIGYIGKGVQVFTSTGTSTFSVPTGIKRVSVECQGAGGGGGGTSSGSTAGAGSGGYSTEIVDVSGTTSIQVFVGTAGTSGSNTSGTTGTWSTFGTNGFYLFCNGGTGGTNSNVAGIGGTASGGDINITGQAGQIGASPTSNFRGGFGGDSKFGFGGVNGNAPTGYGAGGDGCANSGGACSGTAGTNGIVVVRW